MFTACVDTGFREMYNKTTYEIHQDVVMRVYRERKYCFTTE